MRVRQAHPDRTQPDDADDVVTLLTDQHKAIAAALGGLLEKHGDDRLRAFAELRKLIAVHEAVEEQVVHLRVRHEFWDGDVIVSDRLHEELIAKQMLVDLSKVDPHSGEFVETFAALRTHVLAHMEHEESQEFDRLRRELPARQLRRMARRARIAQAISPTRPHPGRELTGENLAAGPFAAVVDRARDLISGIRR